MASKKYADRAKIFAPFDALKGFREALRLKERITVPKMILSEDMKYDLDWKFKQLKPADMVTIIHYDNGDYIKTTGMISLISLEGRFIQVVNTRIYIDDIIDIQDDKLDTLVDSF